MFRRHHSELPPLKHVQAAQALNLDVDQIATLHCPTANNLRYRTEQLRDLPPALIITGEADVLRDEGEAFAAKLRRAGVAVTAVRYTGILHDFVMLNQLHDTQAARAAIAQAATTLKEALYS